MRRPSVLFLTNSEHGQSNVILAVASELLLRGEYDVHIASTSILEPRVSQLRDSLVSEHTGTLTFQLIDGLSMLEIYGAKKGTINLPHPPGIKGAIQSMSTVPDILLFWGESGYIQCFEQCKRLIQDISPAAVVVDPLFSTGIDACRVSLQRLIILNPLTLKDVTVALQPGYVHWWKFPV